MVEFNSWKLNDLPNKACKSDGNLGKVVNNKVDALLAIVDDKVGVVVYVLVLGEVMKVVGVVSMK